MLPEVRYPDVKLRRDKLRAMQWCICGPFAPPGTPSKMKKIAHGPVVKAGKCARCVAVHDRKEAR